MASCTGHGTPDQAGLGQCIRELVDVHYPQATSIRLVLDNLNTHTGASLYEAFRRRSATVAGPLGVPSHPQARQLAQHGGNRNGVLKGQCLDRRLDNADWLRSEVSAWEERRNKQQVKIHWSFTIAVARHKLKKLYPVIENSNPPI